MRRSREQNRCKILPVVSERPLRNGRATAKFGVRRRMEETCSLTASLDFSRRIGANRNRATPPNPLGKRNLLGSAEIGEQVQHFPVGELFEQAFGHHGNGSDFAGLNFGLVQHDVLADSSQG